MNLPYRLTVEVNDGGVSPGENTAYFFESMIHLGAGDGKTYKTIARDPSIVAHETSHAFIESITPLPTQGEGGSLNEAFADFFATTILSNPRLGEVAYVPGPYKRTLEVSTSYSERNGGLYHDSQIVSGTLWSLRPILGPEKTFDLALKTLSRLSAQAELKDFPQAMQYALGQGFTEDEAAKINQLLKLRGWTL